MPLFCTHCGAKVPAQPSKFCTGCGATLPVAGAPAQAAPQPPPPQYAPPQQYAPPGYPPPAYPQYPPSPQYAPPAPAPTPAYEPPKPFVVDTTVKYMVPDALKSGSPLDALGNAVKGATAGAPAGEPSAPSGGMSSLLGALPAAAGVGSVLAMAGVAAKSLFGGSATPTPPAPSAPTPPQPAQSMWGNTAPSQPSQPSQPLPPVPVSQPQGKSIWDLVGAPATPVAPPQPAPTSGSMWDAAPAAAPAAAPKSMWDAVAPPQPAAPAPAPKQGGSMWDAVGAAPTPPVAAPAQPAPSSGSMWDAVGAPAAPVAPPQPAAAGSMWDAIGSTPAQPAAPAQPAPSAGSMWDAIGAPAEPAGPKTPGKAKASRTLQGAEASEPSSGGAQGEDLMAMLGSAVTTFAPMLEQAATAAGYKEVAAGIHQVSQLFTTIVHPRGHQVVIGGHKEATDDPTDVHYDAHLAVDPAGLPRHVDLRPGMSTVEDQGQIGSCTANAIAGAYEFLERKQTGRYTDVSRLFIYYLERQFEHSIAEDSGAELRDGMKALQQYGVCSEAVWPYNPKHFKNKPSPEAFAEAKNHTISEFRRVPIELDAIRHCLAEGFPMCFGAEIYKSFEAEGHHGLVSMPRSREESLGGHAMLLVGYDDQKQLFIVRNSWGSDWGDGGYCYFPYAYLTDPELCTDIWTVRKGDNLQFNGR